MFDHIVPLNMDERLTIIHGPNGFGKTALLKLIHGLFERRFAVIRNIPFKQFIIDFENNCRLLIEHDKEKEKQLKINFVHDGIKEQPYILKEFKVPDELRHNIEDVEFEIPELDRVGPDRWVDTISGEILTLSEVLENYGDILQIPIKSKSEPDWFTQILLDVPVHFIETQRLLTIPVLAPPYRRRHRRGSRLISAVAKYSNELSTAIQSKLAESATLSQSLDRTFPARLVKHKPSSDLTEEQLRIKLNELEEKRSRLMEAGLLERVQEIDIEVPGEIDETKKPVLSVYIEDAKEKLSIFDEITNKIELMKNIINDHFKFKTLSISKEQGFIFINSLGNPLSPTDLSSGEQHELVLLYELLFKVKPWSLILIDEPELSLHIAWQEQVLNDLEKITKLADLYVIMATHSPQIIHDRWDLTVELKEPQK